MHGADEFPDGLHPPGRPRCRRFSAASGAARHIRPRLHLPHLPQGRRPLLGSGELAAHSQPQRCLSGHPCQHPQYRRSQGDRSQPAPGHRRTARRGKPATQISAGSRTGARPSGFASVGDEPRYPVRRGRRPRDLPQPHVQSCMADRGGRDTHRPADQRGPGQIRLDAGTPRSFFQTPAVGAGSARIVRQLRNPDDRWPRHQRTRLSGARPRGALHRASMDLRGHHPRASDRGTTSVSGLARCADRVVQPSPLPAGTGAHHAGSRSPPDAMRRDVLRPREFKSINDSYGHRAGDVLLIRVAGEIGALVRHNEVLARLGGDEFAILLPTVLGKEAEMLADRVVRAIAQIPFRFEGHNLRLTTSLGIAYYPGQAADADDLVARADIAMYQAKDAGKNTWRVFRADISADSEMRSRLSWGERVSNALDKSLFQLHFQGVYRAQDGSLSHLEALIRMIDAATQLIMPTHFIQLAEKSGCILDIDRWVIHEVVCRLAENPAIPSIAVNLSGRSLSEPTLPQYIGTELRQSGVDPARLIVEITETAAVSDLHDAQRLIDALRQLGCGVCLDDFGVGFASFAYLKHLQVDIIKIDGLFIRDLSHDPDNQVFVRAMVSVGRGLGKSVVAEYVEDDKTLALLREFGVDLVQGYHLDHPVADHPALMR